MSNFSSSITRLLPLSDVAKIIVLILATALATAWAFCSDEQWNSLNATWSYWVLWTFIVVVSCMVIAYALMQMNRRSAKAADKYLLLGSPSPHLLDSGNANPIAPNEWVVSQNEDETQDGDMERMRREVLLKSPGLTEGKKLYWFIFRSPTMYVIDHEGGFREYDRETPVYQKNEWPEDRKIDPAGFDYTRESWSHFIKHLEIFCYHLPRYLTHIEMKNSELPYVSLVGSLGASAIKKVATLLVFFCLSLSAFSQSKSDRVQAYLGEKTYNAPATPGPIKFVFEKLNIDRTGNSVTTWKDLLSKDPYFNDGDNAGALKYIKDYKGVIRPIAPPPVKVENLKPQTYNADIIPHEPKDSAYWEHYFREKQSDIEGWKVEAEAGFKPFWKFCMYLFSIILALSIPFGFWLRYVAKTASNETWVGLYSGRTIVGGWMRAAHQNASGALMVLCWGAALVFLLDSYVWLAYHNYNMWLIVVIGIPVIGSMEYITDWIVPDVKTVSGGGFSKKGQQALQPGEY